MPSGLRSLSGEVPIFSLPGAADGIAVDVFAISLGAKPILPLRVQRDGGKKRGNWRATSTRGRGAIYPRKGAFLAPPRGRPDQGRKETDVRPECMGNLLLKLFMKLKLVSPFKLLI